MFIVDQEVDGWGNSFLRRCCCGFSSPIPAGSSWTGVLRGLEVETDIAAYDCEKVVAMVRGESLQNVFGGSFRIVEISNVLPQSHCKDAISCTGDVSISNGTTERMLLSVRKSRDAGANGLVYEVRPL